MADLTDFEESVIKSIAGKDSDTPVAYLQLVKEGPNANFRMGDFDEYGETAHIDLIATYLLFLERHMDDDRQGLASKILERADSIGEDPDVEMTEDNY